MYKYFKRKDMQINTSLLLTLNVRLRIGKCTPRGTCTPGWGPLHWSMEARCSVSNEWQLFKHRDSHAEV